MRDPDHEDGRVPTAHGPNSAFVRVGGVMVRREAFVKIERPCYRCRYTWPS